MIQVFPELPEWKFDVDEISAGVYEIVGTDGVGHRIQLRGTDPDALFAEARLSASRIRDQGS